MKRILVTLGDPLGIGPEVAIKALAKIPRCRNVFWLVIGAYSSIRKIAVHRKLVRRTDVAFSHVDEPAILATPRHAGLVAMACLDIAVNLLRTGMAQALVTAPICKEHMRSAGFKFPGHTEYLCASFSVKKFAMMLFHEKLRVVLTTIHEPLSRVPELITRAAVREKLELTAIALSRHFAVKRPRIAVCGLNPHAGEAGLMGMEEISVIRPAMDAFMRTAVGKKTELKGPLPADTVFYRALKGEYDAVLCHYHDQGLIPIKTFAFERGVNMTLGLPFLRVSPDHGTAFDIAGKGIADPTSMLMALQAAVRGIIGGNI